MQPNPINMTTATAATTTRFNRSFLQTYLAENNIQMDPSDDISKINRNTRIRGKCKNNGCEKYFHKPFRAIIQHSGPYCDPCSHHNRIQKMRNRCLEKYGVEYSCQSDDVKQKKKDTCLKKYGVDNPLQSEDIKRKIKETCLEKYGVEHPLQTNAVKQKKINTCLRNHGVEYSFQSECIRNKSKQTCLEKYGVEHPFQSKQMNPKKCPCAQQKKENVVYGYVDCR